MWVPVPSSLGASSAACPAMCPLSLLVHVVDTQNSRNSSFIPGRGLAPIVGAETLPTHACYLQPSTLMQVAWDTALHHPPSPCKQSRTPSPTIRTGQGATGKKIRRISFRTPPPSGGTPRKKKVLHLLGHFFRKQNPGKCLTVGAKGAIRKISLMPQRGKKWFFTPCVYTQNT